MKRLRLIGVPTSAGAHGPGQEKAPDALRRAGLSQALSSAGIEVKDAGNLPPTRFVPDPKNPKRQSVDRVRETAARTAEAVAEAVHDGDLPFLLGGDCSITLGLVAGAIRSTPDIGLLYFDGDADMTTPETTRSGIFDSMGMAHLLGIPGAAPALARLGSRYPLLTEDRVVLFGFQPYELEPDEARLLERSSVLQYPVSSIKRRPAETAREALRHLEERAPAIVVHFDVDVMDSAEIPLGNWPHYEALSLDEAMECLQVFVATPKLAALVVTEINPDHDPDGLLLSRFVDGLVHSLRPLAAQRTAR